jgi:hypothetical protein
MRFFIIACVFCGLIGSVGCMTNNWSSSMFPNQKSKLTIVDDQQTEDESSDEASPKPRFWNTKFGASAGIDPRAREIEKRLGL